MVRWVSTRGSAGQASCGGHFSFTASDQVLTGHAERVIRRRCKSLNSIVNSPSIGPAYALRNEGAGGTKDMRLRITLFTAAFVILPVAAFALLLGGMLWDRLSGVA